MGGRSSIRAEAASERTRYEERILASSRRRRSPRNVTNAETGGSTLLCCRGRADRKTAATPLHCDRSSKTGTAVSRQSGHSSSLRAKCKRHADVRWRRTRGRKLSHQRGFSDTFSLARDRQPRKCGGLGGTWTLRPRLSSCYCSLLIAAATDDYAATTDFFLCRDVRGTREHVRFSPRGVSAPSLLFPSLLMCSLGWRGSVVVRLERGHGRRRRREPFAGRHRREHLTHLPVERRRLTSFGPHGIRKRQPADRKAREKGLLSAAAAVVLDRENACRVLSLPTCSLLLSCRAQVYRRDSSRAFTTRQLGKRKATRRCVIVVVAPASNRTEKDAEEKEDADDWMNRLTAASVGHR